MMVTMLNPGKIILALFVLQVIQTVASKSWADPLSVMYHGPPSPPKDHNQRAITEHYLTQKLDHFDIFDNRTWQQRYFINDEYYVEGGPVFLFIGGEMEVSGGFTNLFSFMGRLAYDAGAMAMELEHRYYGRSRPTVKPSLFNRKPSLSGCCILCGDHMKTELGLNNHWIIFGVSYSGALVAWARAAYPHIFHAAYSSSAPILAQADFGEYHEVTGIAQAETDPECPIYVSEGMNELQRLITEGGASLDYVSELFYICEPGLNASSSLDITTLNSMVANFFGALVQYAGSDGQKNTCNKIMNGPGTTLENMAEIVKEGYLGMCLTTDYNIVMDYYRTITAWEPINIVRQWLYTACTELGWFTPLSTPDSPFGQLFPVDYFTQWCTDIYGPTFTPQLLEEGIQRTNTIRGGLTPEVTRVLYTHGTLDQYHRLGANKDLGPDTPVIMIEGSSHSSDMGWNVSSDSAALVAARERASDIITAWLELP